MNSRPPSKGRLPRLSFGLAGKLRSIEAALLNPNRQEAARYIIANGLQHPEFRRLVSSGDLHRDAHRWSEGFADYRSALDILPLHAGYLVQAAHCLKGMGNTVAAEGYYRSALVLGAPLADVAEHLLFVCERNSYSEDVSRLQHLATAVQNGSAQVAHLPTLDELIDIVQACGASEYVDVAVLVDLLRSKAGFEDAIETIRSRSHLPTLPLAGNRRGIRPTHTAEFTLRLPRTGESIAIAQDLNAADDRPSTPSAPPVSLAEIHDMARRFAEGRLEASTPLFFGSIPASEDPVNVSLLDEAAPLLSVIVLNYNSAHLTLLAAGAVMAANTEEPYEILIVDNGSCPSDKDLLKHSKLPFRFIDLPRNTGFGEGNNIAVDAARGQYLLFLNSDAFVAPGTIGELLRAFESIEEVGAVGALYRYPDGLVQEAGSFVSSSGLTIQRGKRNPNFDITKLPRVDVVDYVSAACLLMKHDDFLAVGGFPSQYDLAYSEDVDLCLRLGLLRKLVVVARDATCFHIESATVSTPEIADLCTSASEVNRWTLLGSWGPFLSSRLRKDQPHELLPTPKSLPSPVARSQAAAAAILPDTPPIGPDLRYLLTLGASASAEGAFVASSSASSTTRLRNIEAWLECPFQFGGMISPGDFAERKSKMLFVSGNGALPPEIPTTGRAFLVVTTSSIVGNLDQSARDAIAARFDRFERVLVPSMIARQALQTTLASHSLPFPRQIDVVAPTIPNATISMPGARMPWLLSVTTFGEPDRKSPLFNVIDAISRTEKSFRSEWKLVACGSVHTARHAVQEIRELKATATELGVSAEFIINLPPGRLRSLYSRSTIFIEPRGFGFSGADHDWQCDLLGTGTMRALVAGCRTLAWTTGAAAEVLRTVRAGEVFGSTDELIFRLVNPPPPADHIAQKTMMSRFGDAGLKTRIQSLLSST
ncbi:MAG: glycosyltransferase [Hyphomicrobiaceae bacterium]